MNSDQVLISYYIMGENMLLSLILLTNLEELSSAEL